MLLQPHSQVVIIPFYADLTKWGIPHIFLIETDSWPQMNDRSYPTDATLRDSLIERVERFIALAGGSRTSVGRDAVGDGHFVHDVANGDGFTITRYSRLMTWLDDNWPKETQAAE
jgi:hypothetical protein